MKNSKTLDKINLLHPKLRIEVLSIYDEILLELKGKATCIFTDTLRTFKEQDKLYAKGRSQPGAKVTNARGGQSFHNYGLAIDIALLVDKDNNGTFESASWETKIDFDGDKKADWGEVVTIFKRHGWLWGGDWKFVDGPHFEKTFNKSLVELEKAYRGGSLDDGGYVLI